MAHALGLPDPAYLHTRLRYDPDTGKLYWRECSGMSPQWNGRYAGEEAGTLTQRGYIHVFMAGHKLLAHRIVWAMHHGAWPEDEIDHDDRDKSHNRIENLFLKGRLGNARNQPLRKDSSTGVVGVSWHHRDRKWRAYIGGGSGGQQQYLGSFTQFDDAVAARKSAEAERGFHPNHGGISETVS